MIASLVLPANPLNSADPFGFGMRPLAGLLLCWDRRPAAAERHGGGHASRRCSPLKHSCLWAVVRKCKTKSRFVLPGQWMCTHRVERRPVGQRQGFDWLCSSAQGSWKRHHLHFISQSRDRKWREFTLWPLQHVHALMPPRASRVCVDVRVCWSPAVCTTLNRIYHRVGARSERISAS